jgi:hypothetical protein
MKTRVFGAGSMKSSTIVTKVALEARPYPRITGSLRGMLKPPACLVVMGLCGWLLTSAKIVEI